MKIQGIDIEKMPTKQLKEWIHSKQTIQQQRMEHIHNMYAEMAKEHERIKRLMIELDKRD